MPKSKEIRAYWNGHVRLSLIAFPVSLFAAVVESEKVHLHKIDRKTGQRIHYQNVNEDRKVVEAADIVKGYEYEKDQYVQIEDRELDKLKLESTHMIDIVQFTDASAIDPIYFDRPFYMVPEDKLATEAFVTLRDALKSSKKVALGQITIAGKERIAAIKPSGRGLVLETLRYDYEVRKASAVFEDIPQDMNVSDEQIALARELIKKKNAAFDPKKFKDRYQESLLEVIEAKLHHRKAPQHRAAKPSAQVIDIMDALKRSLGQSGESSKKPKAKSKTKAARKSTAAKKKRKAG